jgi:hypothetical protein
MSQTMPSSVSPAQAPKGGGHRVNKPRRLNPPLAPNTLLHADDESQESGQRPDDQLNLFT